MARLISTGFELRDPQGTSGLGALASPDGSFATGASVETTTIRSGSASRKCVTAGATASNGGNLDFPAVALGTDCFVRVYIYVPTGGFPATGSNSILAVGASGFQYQLSLVSDGTLILRAKDGLSIVQQGSASSAVSPDTWHKIELRANTGTGSVDACEGRLDGATFASASGLTGSDAGINGVIVGIDTNSEGLGGATTIYFDDLAVNDGSGGNQNTWPPDSSIVLLVPTADSAKGTGWTNDAAGASSFFDATDNKPPAGIADTTAGSGLHQIRNATSNANSNYDATMTTYTAAGVGAGATVNVVVPVVATAAPVVTSAKAGTVGVVSNPAITNVALGPGGTSGAFWSGVAGGTYTTGWKWSYGTTTYAPSVTLGTAPVMRITQVTSSTRIAMVCFMGIYVDYTPLVVANPPYVNPMPPFLAQ